MRRQTCFFTLILILFTLSGTSAAAQTPGSPAQAPAAATQAPAEKPDLRQLRRDIRVFAGIVDTTIRESLPEPFGLLETTKGTYLPGFGLVFSLEVNLVALRVRSPFDPRPLSKEELEQAFKLKQERIAELEQRMLPRLLADYGANIEMPASDRLAVVMHLFNFPEEDREELPARLVVEASRQDLLEYKQGKIPYPDFAKRVLVLKF